ncbi:hypothetical protein ACWCXB_03865 [Streptomyces sp. NPDC001514]
MRRSWWSTRLATGGLTSLAAVSLVSALSAVPAAAQGLNAEPPSTVVSTDRGSLPSAYPALDRDKDRDKDKDKDKGKGRPKPPTPPTPPPPPPPVDAACFEIDTVRQEAAGDGAFYSAVSFGRPFVGEEDGQLGPIDWLDLSAEEFGDAPENPCGTSIDIGPVGEENGSEIVVDVITTDGLVYTIVCERTGGSIDSCGTWAQRDTPEEGDTLDP